MITIQDLAFRYSKQAVIFEGLNLEIAPGHIHGLLGKNGVGKTTLLKLIGGLTFPGSGSVTVDGHNPAKREPRLLADILRSGGGLGALHDATEICRNPRWFLPGL